MTSPYLWYLESVSLSFRYHSSTLSVKTDANKSFRFLAMSLLSLIVSSTCLGWPAGYLHFLLLVLSKCSVSLLTSYCLLFRFPLIFLKLHLNYYILYFQLYTVLFPFSEGFLFGLNNLQNFPFSHSNISLSLSSIHPRGTILHVYESAHSVLIWGFQFFYSFYLEPLIL